MHGLTRLEQHFSNNRSNHVFNRKPVGIKGSISAWEARFLHATILEKKPEVCLEIGTGAGISSAIMANALSILKAVYGGERRLHSVDCNEFCWFDKTKPVGFFLGEFAPELTEYVTFWKKPSAFEVHDILAPKSVGLVFIDANHKHPWPSLDLLATLPYLTEDAVVVLHDINLAANMPDFAESNGAKYLFDGVPLEKATCAGQGADKLPNIGAFTLNGTGNAALADRIRTIVGAHEWEAKVDDATLSSAGLSPQA